MNSGAVPVKSVIGVTYKSNAKAICAQLENLSLSEVTNLGNELKENGYSNRIISLLSLISRSKFLE